MSGGAYHSSDTGQERPSLRAGGESAGASAIIIAVLGGIATAVGVTGMLAQFCAASVPRLALLPVSDVDAAVTSLTLGWSNGLAGEAKGCRAPLSFVTVATRGAARPATVRIRSGSYVSPWFAVTERPQQVALPFPAPYPTGQGTLIAEGSGENVHIAIQPEWLIDRLEGAVPRGVTWQPGNAC